MSHLVSVISCDSTATSTLINDCPTPRKKKRKYAQLRQIKSRASSKISTSINENLKNVPNEKRTGTLVTALKKCDELSKSIDHCRKPPVKPQGISRCFSELINQVWSFWKENSTVTNARTSRQQL